jgi:hypothetical protein
MQAEFHLDGFWIGGAKAADGSSESFSLQRFNERNGRRDDPVAPQCIAPNK